METADAPGPNPPDAPSRDPFVLDPPPEEHSHADVERQRVDSSPPPLQTDGAVPSPDAAAAPPEPPLSGPAIPNSGCAALTNEPPPPLSDPEATAHGPEADQLPPVSDGSAASSSKPLPPLSPEVRGQSETANLVNVSSLGDGQSGGRPTRKPVMPGELPRIVYHAPDSLVYKTLALQPVPPMDARTRASLIVDLRRYIELCSQRGLINEASYVNDVVATVRTVPAPTHFDRRWKQVHDDLAATEAEMTLQNEYWDNQIAIHTREYEMTVHDIDVEYAQRQAELDEEWASEAKQKRYAKPSPEYLNMRYRSQRMVMSKQFTKMGVITQMMSERQQLEATDAMRRMEDDYRRADGNLRTNYDAEKLALRLAYEKRMNNIARERERSLKPYRQRCQAIRERADELREEGRNPQRPIKVPPPVLPNVDNRIMATINDAPRLRLPRFNVRRRTASATRTERAPSSVSGMEVSRGTLSVSSMVHEGRRPY